MATDLPYDLTRLARWCGGLLTAVLVFEVLMGLSAVYSLLEVRRAIEGETNPITVLAGTNYWWSDIVSLAIGLPYLVVYLGTLIISAFWIYRSNANSAALVPSEKRTGPGWAVGAFFVPIVNLFWPFRAMKETWNSSTRADGDLTMPVPGWMSLWWGAWVLSNIVAQVAENMVEDSSSFETLATSWTLDIINTPIAFVAAFLFRRLIREITEAQAMPARRLEEVFA